MYPSIFNSFPVIRTAMQKNRRFHVPQPTFLFPLKTPLRLSRNMLHGWKDNSMLAKPLAAYLSNLYSFRVIWCLNQCVSPKNRYFYHIFVSPGDAPGAITLIVVWMEKQFDVYKLSRCICPSNYKHFWDRARYLWKKIVILSYPLHSTPPLRGFPSEYRHPIWYGKTRMVGLPDGKKMRICVTV